MTNISQKGFTLIEVVISLIVMGFGILALSQLFWFSAASGTESFYRTRAHVQALDIGERFWLDLTDPEGAVAQWQSEHANSLPGWSGDVAADSPSDTNLYTVSIAWTGSATHPPGNATYLVRTPTVSAP